MNEIYTGLAVVVSVLIVSHVLVGWGCYMKGRVDEDRYQRKMQENNNRQNQN